MKFSNFVLQKINLPVVQLHELNCQILLVNKKIND